MEQSAADCELLQSLEDSVGSLYVARSSTPLLHPMLLRYSSASGSAYQPRVHIGSLSTRYRREETRWYDIGGYDATSEGSRATQQSPESMSMNKSHLPNRLEIGMGKHWRAASPVEEGDEAADLAVNQPPCLHGHTLASPLDIHFVSPSKTTVAKEGGFRARQFPPIPISTVSVSMMRGVGHVDNTKGSEPVTFSREKRNTLGSRSPSRHQASQLEEKFDAFDEKVYMNEWFHEPLQRRATLAVGAQTPTLTPPSNENSGRLSVSFGGIGQGGTPLGHRDHAFNTGRLHDHYAETLPSDWRQYSSHRTSAASSMILLLFVCDANYRSLHSRATSAAIYDKAHTTLVSSRRT